jgi:hypothetical protein
MHGSHCHYLCPYCGRVHTTRSPTLHGISDHGREIRHCGNCPMPGVAKLPQARPHKDLPGQMLLEFDRHENKASKANRNKSK